MPTSREWQLAGEAARRYQEILVPSILGPAARALVDAVPMEPGERVLDVGCGTGAASRLAASKVGPGGVVVGVDVNPGMLACAAATSDGSGVRVEWREASATELPFPEGSFDVVLCAQTLQFLRDRAPAVSEMRRVVREGGRVAVSTWAALDRSPYFLSLVEAMRCHVGDETAAGLASAFGLCDPDELLRLLTDVGLQGVRIDEVDLELDLPPLDEFVPRHVSSTPMAAGYASAPDSARLAVVQEVTTALGDYRTGDGVRVPFRPLIATGTR